MVLKANASRFPAFRYINAPARSRSRRASNRAKAHGGAGSEGNRPHCAVGVWTRAGGSIFGPRAFGAARPPLNERGRRFDNFRK
jgi:hypothetical protein